MESKHSNLGVGGLINQLGLKKLVDEIRPLTRLMQEYSNPDLSEEEYASIKQKHEEVSEQYKILEKKLRTKFGELALNDNTTATIMDYVWTS